MPPKKSATKPRAKRTATTTVSKEDAAQPPKTTSRSKRPADGELEEQKAVTKRQKRTRDVGAVPVRPIKKPKEKIILTTAPSTRLDVFVFGSNSGGELGLGGTFKKAECNRPRLNPLLSDAGIVQISTGGMHSIALTHDNKVLTWGVNDQGALGRDTQWEGGLVDIDKEENGNDDDDDDEIDVNPKESTPTTVDMAEIPPGTVFTQVAAADSASFALTEEGLIYGWGTFRGGSGVFGFSPKVDVQRQPTLVRELRNVTKIAAGSNHIVALILDGTIQTWGSGEQDQLGRRFLERRKRLHALTPHKIAVRKGFVDIGTGSDHSFAIHKDGTVYSWGSNNYGQTGISSKAGENEATILHPTAIPSLRDRKVVCASGGNSNSVAVTERGECLVWGRIDNNATGLDKNSLPGEAVIYDDRGKPRILKDATQLPTFEAVYAAFGTDHAIAITKDGKAYSWGFNSSYQTGHPGDDDVEVATMINSKAVRERRLTWAGAGGQYGMLAAEKALPLTNGVVALSENRA